MGLAPFGGCLYFVDYKVRFPLGIEKIWLCIKKDHASMELLDNQIKSNLGYNLPSELCCLKVRD
jgi:hypothetical protein